jgi:hypothetical protein
VLQRITAVGRIQQCSPERGFVHDEHLPARGQRLAGAETRLADDRLRPTAGGRHASALATRGSSGALATRRVLCRGGARQALASSELTRLFASRLD